MVEQDRASDGGASAYVRSFNRFELKYFARVDALSELEADLATHCAPASTYKCGIIYSPDMGKTWAQYDLKEFGPRSGCRIHRKNSDGWFRLDLRKGWIERAEVLFIKPKP